MTERQLRRQVERCISVNTLLVTQLQRLSTMASEVYGRNIVACLCSGDEIEFRECDSYDVMDDTSTIRLEEIIEQL